jgi:4-hydroxybenzoyl-CoA thioesterase
MLTNRREIHVEFGDCDPGGIVYYPRYFEYCDACTVALFARAGLPMPGSLKKYNFAGIPLVDAHARYFIPSQFGDTITVESTITEWGRTSFLVCHKILKGDELAAEVREKRVWVARASDEPVRFAAQPIPQEVKNKFSAETGR